MLYHWAVTSTTVLFSHHSRGALARAFGTIDHGAVDSLVYTHTGSTVEVLRRQRATYSVDQDDYLFVAIHLTDAEFTLIATDLVSATNAAIRVHAPVKRVFDTAVDQLERWLLHDGWVIEDNHLVRVAPAAEITTGVRDKLLEELGSSGLDPNGSIAAELEHSSRAFASAPPDYNAAITHGRIALETLARTAARDRGSTTDTWGAALAFLRTDSILDTDEEQILARIYTFISPGAHVPRGVSHEEWATLARAFGLSATYFLLRKATHAPSQGDAA